jgi:hypothetical protein
MKNSVNFLNRRSKKAQISNFIKIRPMGAKFFHAGEWTDMTTLIVTFGNFAHVRRNQELKKVT